MPIVSTPISGIPELIDDGENGLLVPPNDPQALADALLTLSHAPDRRAAMGRNGQKRVRTDFDAEREIEQLPGIKKRDYSVDKATDLSPFPPLGQEPFTGKDLPPGTGQLSCH